jgi:hypothetical protein
MGERSRRRRCPTAAAKSPRQSQGGYWRWPERNLAGNAIDFHIQVLGLSFHDAMRQITGT